MKDIKQLKNDARSDKELEEKIAAADNEYRRTGSRADFIQSMAELGYEITDEDLDRAEKLTKLDDEELDDVAGGGKGWFGRDEAPDGHDIGCFFSYSYYSTADDYCPPNNGHHSYSEKVGGIEYDRQLQYAYQTYRCSKCSRTIRSYISDD